MSRVMEPVALVIPGSLAEQKGGAGMRWRALAAALATLTRCEVIELACDHLLGCRASCLEGGGPPPNPEAADWCFSHLFCDNHAAGIAGRLLDSGIETVVCSGIETAGYVPRFAEHGGLRIVYDMHNVEYPLYTSQRERSGDEVEFPDSHLDSVWRAESEAIAAADVTWNCSSADVATAAATYRHFDATRALVVPNVVTVTDPPVLPSAVPNHLCFTGILNWYPNELAVHELMMISRSLMERGIPVPTVVAGATPTPALITAGEAAGLRIVASPADTKPFITGAIMAVPLRLGSGSRLKALEAFALGAPVVSTPKGVEGLEVASGDHLLIANTAGEFADAIEQLMTDHEQRDRLITNAWHLVRDRYSVTALAALLQALPA